MSGEKKRHTEPGVKVGVQESAKGELPVWRTFPGPRGAAAHLRVAMERPAYGELIAHAKESLDAEVCGVLVGQVCEDDEGIFIQVDAVIRGAAANQGSTHVTFTQATWTAIHQAMERNHPKLRMVGWYHTHPGFGVEFSDMDLFIQKNFFPSPSQIALVTDPLSGAVAICVNAPEGARYLTKYWVDGREQPCRQPVPAGAPVQEGTVTVTTGDTARSIQALEARVSQLVQVIDDQQNSYHRFLFGVGLMVALAVVGTVGYAVYSQYINRNEPPKLNQYVPVPVQVGDKTVLLGVAVTEWQIPPELDALLLKSEKLKLEMAEKAAKEAAEKGGTNAAGTNATTKAPKK